MQRLLPIAATAALALPAGYVLADITTENADAKRSPNQVQVEQLQYLQRISQTASRQAKALDGIDGRLDTIERRLTGGLDDRPIGDLVELLLEEVRRR